MSWANIVLWCWFHTSWFQCLVLHFQIILISIKIMAFSNSGIHSLWFCKNSYLYIHASFFFIPWKLIEYRIISIHISSIMVHSKLNYSKWYLQTQRARQTEWILMGIHHFFNFAIVLSHFVRCRPCCHRIQSTSYYLEKLQRKHASFCIQYHVCNYWVPCWWPGTLLLKWFNFNCSTGK